MQTNAFFTVQKNCLKMRLNQERAIQLVNPKRIGHVMNIYIYLKRAKIVHFYCNRGFFVVSFGMMSMMMKIKGMQTLK